MELTCNKCDGKNPLGAIYCRTCGEKLDVNDLKPTDIKKSNSGFKINYLFFYRLSRITITCAFIAFFVCAFWPQTYSVPEESSSKEKRYEALSLSLFGRVRGEEDMARVSQLNFAEDDLHYAIHREMDTYESIDDLTAKVALSTKEVAFRFVEEEDALMINHELEFKVFGIAIPIHQKVKVNIVPEDGFFAVEKAWQGIIPLPSQFNAIILSSLASGCLTDGDNFESWLNDLRSVSFVTKKIKVRNEEGKKEEQLQRQLSIGFVKEKK